MLEIATEEIKNRSNLAAGHRVQSSVCFVPRIPLWAWYPIAGFFRVPGLAGISISQAQVLDNLKTSFPEWDDARPRARSATINRLRRRVRGSGAFAATDAGCASSGAGS